MAENSDGLEAVAPDHRNDGSSVKTRRSASFPLGAVAKLRCSSVKLELAVQIIMCVR